MADTTTNYGFPYPEDTDSPSGHLQIQLLAEAVDTDLLVVDNRVTTLENKVPLVNQLSADSSAITTTALTTVMSITLPATGTYLFDGLFLLTNTSAAGRPGFGMGGTSTASSWRWAGSTVHYNTATASQGSTASGTTYPAVSSAIVNSDFTTTSGFSSFHVKGTVVVTATGSITFRFAEASGSGTVTIRAGSILSIQKIA